MRITDHRRPDLTGTAHTTFPNLPPAIQTPDYGGVRLAKTLYDRWNADGRGLIGWPIGDSFDLPNGGSAVYGERGMIVAARGGKALVVHGRIYLKYRDLNDVHGWVGLPQSDETAAANGGRVSYFEHADIYWCGATDAHEVHGAIRERYAALGGPGGFLGYPFTDETPVRRGAQEAGRSNRFEGGLILWSPATGAWEVHGAIREAWENAHKGATGEFGFPVSNETRTATDTYRYNDFERGTIVWKKADGLLHALTRVEFYLDGFGSKGSDGIGGGAQDVYVKLSYQAPHAGSKSMRMPERGDYGGDEAIRRVLFTEGPMRGGTSIHVRMEGWDSDTFSDDRLGTLDRTYNIENLWGLEEDASHWTGDFQARYKLRAITDFDHSKFRENYYWKFHNFSTKELSWRQYAETFTDVDNDESAVWHPFDHLFYQLVYKGVANGGNCFGMCWESLFAQAGHSIYREPIALVPPTDGSRPDPGRNRETVDDINVKHGYQVSGQMIDYVAPMFLTGGTHDPKGTFRSSRDEWNRGDYPVLALTKASLGLSGHVVRPYAWDDSRKPWRIYVCDPNQPLGAGPDPRDTFIEIDPDANTFRFKMAGGEVWSGGTWSGGRCYSLPHHVVCGQPRTPFWEALALLVAGSLIVLGGDAKTAQIRDAAGRTFYKPNLANGPQNWEDLQDDARRIPGLARVPSLGHLSHRLDPSVLGNVHLGGILAAGHPPELYWATRTAERAPVRRLLDVHGFAAGAGLPSGALEATIAQGSGAATWAVRTPVASHVVTTPSGAASRDALLLEGSGTAGQAVTLTSDREKAVGIIIVGGLGAAGRGFKVEGLGLRAGERVRTHLEPETGALVVENPGAATRMDVAALAGPMRAGVPIEANSVTRFAPESWTPGALATGKLRMEALTPATGEPREAREI